MTWYKVQRWYYLFLLSALRLVHALTGKMIDALIDISNFFMYTFDDIYYKVDKL